MEANEVSQCILEGLVELEESGDLVITHAAPLVLAEKLGTRLIELWAREFVDSPPHEVVIAGCIKAATRHLEGFGLEHEAALSAVSRFVKDRQRERTLGELADLLAHQGSREIAMGSYYCVHLGRGKYYDPDYLTWRSTTNHEF